MRTTDSENPEATFDGVFQRLLADLVSHGELVPIGESLSVASGRETREILNYRLRLPNPRDRVITNAARKMNPFHAVGRFIWMMAGSRSLQEIAFYEPRVAYFTDDQTTVPGSADGFRIINCGPPEGQLRASIELLRNESNTRRAVLSVFHPTDAGRSSRDIPCTIAIALNLRGDGLHVSTLMRANNALTLLPYDVFEFSLLGEVVAAQLDVPYASYHHFMVSAHIYTDDIPQVERVLATPAPRAQPMPAMPSDDVPGNLKRLRAFEQEWRGKAERGEITNVDKPLAYLRDALPPYWADLGRVVLIRAVEIAGFEANQPKLRHEIAAALQPPLSTLVKPG